MRMRQVEPRLPIIALTDGTSLQIGRLGRHPGWVGWTSTTSTAARWRLRGHSVRMRSTG
jgi:hypothetical protein